MAVTARTSSMYGNTSSFGVGGTIATGPLYGDAGTVVLIFIAAQGDGQSIGDCDGWTRIYDAAGEGTQSHTQAAFSHVLTQAEIDEPTDPEYSFPLGFPAYAVWSLMAYDGADPTTPVAVSDVNASAVDGTTATTPSITTPQDGCRIVEGFSGSSTSSVDVSGPDTWRGSWSGNPPEYPALGISDQAQVSAGATGTIDGGVSPASSWVAGIVALQPVLLVTGGWGVGQVRMGAA